jgi:hypothetical protein
VLNIAGLDDPEVDPAEGASVHISEQIFRIRSTLTFQCFGPRPRGSSRGL